MNVNHISKRRGSSFHVCLKELNEKRSHDPIRVAHTQENVNHTVLKIYQTDKYFDVRRPALASSYVGEGDYMNESNGYIKDRRMYYLQLIFITYKGS